MANNYDKILELANANNMGLSNTIKRDFGIPLDYTSVQASYEAALTYAATNTLAYVGQPISVGDKLYIVTAESQGKYPEEVEEGGTQIDVFLAEVGSATEGDGKTIDLKDGVLSLHGIDGKLTGTYVPSLINGVLTWNVPDTSTAEGQQQAIDALENRADALEAVVGKAAEGETEATGLVKAVSDNAAAITAEATARAEAVSGEATARGEAIKAVTDSIGTVAEGKTVVKMIEDAEAAAKAAIPTAVSAFTNDAGYLTEHQDISGKADKATTLAGYGITDAYTKDQVDNIVSGMTHMSTSIVDAAPSVDDAEEGVIYLVADETAEAGTYLEYILVTGADGVNSVEQIGSTKTDLSDYAKTADVNAALDLKANASDVYTTTIIDKKVDTINDAIDEKLAIETYNTDKATFAIKSEVETALGGKVDNATLDSYYTKTDADALLAEKADAEDTTVALATKIETASITHTSEGVSEGVIKEGTNLKIVVDAYNKEQVYTKSETDAAITAKINSVTGGESAADVKLALEDYRDSLNAEVWGETARNWTTRTTGEDGKVTVTYTPQYGTTSRVDALETDVATLKTNVQTAQTTADNAATAVTTLENGQVKTNKENIATLTTIINGANAEDKNGLSYRVGALETANTTHATEYATLKSKVDTAVDKTIPAVTARVGANEGAITTINGTLTTHAEEIGKKANAADVYTKGEVDATVATINENIGKKADAATTYTKTEVDNLLANLDQTELENGIAANAADIAVLVGDDKDAETGRANKSIRAIAADEINTLIKAADPEGGKTIENINNLITYVDENAGEIAELITATGANTAKLAGIETTVAAAIEAAKEEAISEATYTLEVATAEKLGGIKSATGDNKVTVAEDGTASVGAVNVNTLVQTIGDLLILDGGSATV